jgi:lactoylglutathione lyase
MADSRNKALGFRIRHTALRVSDLEKSIAFYTDLLGMTLFRRRENEKRAETVAYVGYGEEASSHAIELIKHHADPQGFTHAVAYGHIALGVPDIESLSRKLMAAGVSFILPPQHNRPGSKNKLAFIKDPNGYEIELTEQH